MNSLTHWLLDEHKQSAGWWHQIEELPMSLPKLPQTVEELDKLYECYWEGIQAALQYQFPPHCPYSRGFEFMNGPIDWSQHPKASAWFAGYWKQSRSMADFEATISGQV